MTSIKKNHVVNCINYANENRLFDKLNNIYKSLPSGDCSGCGNCCMESVGTNLIEFINIYNYLENKPELKKMCLDKIIDYYFLEYIDKKPCPFKDKDNREYRDLIKSKYGFDISDKVVNYKIEYCETFIPQERYLEKSERLEFADNLMILDSNIYSKGIIDIDFKDRGIVEYFIESLLNEDTAYNIKVRVSKDKNVRNRAINRLKKILL